MTDADKLPFLIQSVVFTFFAVVYVVLFVFSLDRERAYEQHQRTIRIQRLADNRLFVPNTIAAPAVTDRPWKRRRGGGYPFWCRRFGLISAVLYVPWAIDIHGALGLIPQWVEVAMANGVIALLTAIYSAWCFFYLSHVYRRLAIAAKRRGSSAAATGGTDAAAAAAASGAATSGGAAGAVHHKANGDSATFSPLPVPVPGAALPASSASSQSVARASTEVNSAASQHVLPGWIRFFLWVVPNVYFVIATSLEVTSGVTGHIIWMGVDCLWCAVVILAYMGMMSWTYRLLKRELELTFVSNTTAAAAAAGSGGATGTSTTVMSAHAHPLPGSLARSLSDNLRTVQLYTWGLFTVGIVAGSIITARGVSILSNLSSLDDPSEEPPTTIPWLIVIPYIIAWLILPALWYTSLPPAINIVAGTPVVSPTHGAVPAVAVVGAAGAAGHSPTDVGSPHLQMAVAAPPVALVAASPVGGGVAAPVVAPVRAVPAGGAGGAGGGADQPSGTGRELERTAGSDISLYYRRNGDGGDARHNDEQILSQLPSDRKVPRPKPEMSELMALPGAVPALHLVESPLTSIVVVPPPAISTGSSMMRAPPPPAGVNSLILPVAKMGGVGASPYYGGNYNEPSRSPTEPPHF